MAILFAVRGDNLDARYALGKNGKTAWPFTSSGTAPSVVSDGSAIGGFSIDNTVAGGGIRKGVGYRCDLPFQTNSAWSVLIRFKPNYSGAPPEGKGIFGFNSPVANEYFGSGGMFHFAGAGGMLFAFTGGANGSYFMYDFLPSWSPTAGTWYDFLFSWDGTLSANALKYYIDGSLHHQSSASRRFVEENCLITGVTLGSNWNGTNIDANVGEFVVWNEAVDPSSVALTSGTGALDGASRTAFVDVTEFDGGGFTDPGEVNVRTGQNYLFEGVSKTGSLPLSPEGIAAEIFDNQDVETGLTFRESQRLILSALAGKVSGAPTTEIKIRDINDTTDRITATVDANGNRTDLTYDVD